MYFWFDLGPRLVMLEIIPGSVARDHSWQCQGRGKGCLEGKSLSHRTVSSAPFINICFSDLFFGFDKMKDFQRKSFSTLESSSVYWKLTEYWCPRGEMPRPGSLSHGTLPLFAHVCRLPELKELPLPGALFADVSLLGTFLQGCFPELIPAWHTTYGRWRIKSMVWKGTWIVCLSEDLLVTNMTCSPLAL